MSELDEVASMLREAKRGLAFTGAGVSTESGIPDFRSPGGIWARNQPVRYDDFLNSKAARVQYWKQRAKIYKDFAAAKPNRGHRTLARFEELGRIVGVVTQNIDGLHQDAGSRRVIELHGTSRVIACVACKKEWHPDAVLAMIQVGNEAPDCDDCGAPLKSKTISFGQAMPAAEMNEAIRLSREADLFLAIGSSLVVEPAAGLPRMAKSWGAALVIINQTETPLDDRADLVIRAPIGETVGAVLDRLEWRSNT